jgi:hypothetical protein
MLPVLGREVVEGEQRVAVLAQALDRLVVFATVALDEGVEGGVRILPGLGHPDVVQRALGLADRKDWTSAKQSVTDCVPCGRWAT